MKKWPPREIVLRVLGYKEGRKWIAHCLEMDIVGEASTFTKAFEELQHLVEMQISFAVQEDEPALLDHQAPIEIIRVYEAAQRVALSEFRKSHMDKRHIPAGLSIRPRNRSLSGFAPAHG